ncbi:DUF418 domain-containing protein [Cellvibrio mixtus]|uniref:DUF418 domain-containing protein n=1 Tax=Cellvibrio mixtus TaxID=39650 RepID=UPI000587CCE4|nr:DUF418 domain-containing protein [Cellvibrio mixtus]
MIFSSSSHERNLSLDVLRGMAVLGILLINLYSFALPTDVRASPLQLDDPSLIDTTCWYFLFIFVDGKCIGLLSLCFGASLEYFARRHDQAGLQERRLWWLGVIGCLHGYLLWSGDILFTYALMGWVAWQWRELPLRQLVIMGGVLICVQSILLLLMALLPESVNEEWAVYATPELVSEEIQQYRQPWGAQFSARVSEYIGLQAAVIISGWCNLGLMLIGMAMARLGWFSSGVNHSINRWLLVTLLPGFGLVVMSVYLGWLKNFPAPYTFLTGSALHLLGSMLMAIGYALIGIRYINSNSLASLRYLMAPVGKMAMSLYILQTLVCTFVFYGYGAGLYAHLSLSQLMLFAIVFWLAQIALVHCWLRYFYQGPMEYLWRWLAYRETQPLRR